MGIGRSCVLWCDDVKDVFGVVCLVCVVVFWCLGFSFWVEGEVCSVVGGDVIGGWSCGRGRGVDGGGLFWVGFYWDEVKRGGGKIWFWC